jgi:hypothetical protein
MSVQQVRPLAGYKRSDKSLASEARFLARLAELGATPLYDAWRGSMNPHPIRCAAGHTPSPTPSNVLGGGGVCRECTGYGPIAAEARFRARLAELGATPLYETWLGSDVPHHVRCAAGHDCYKRPASGGGVCSECGGNVKGSGESKFLARLAELGATPLYETWLGSNVAHHVRCAAGHECYPYPSSVMYAEYSICRSCSIKKHASIRSAKTEVTFLSRVAELGGTPLYEAWRGVDSPHHVRCAAGHECYPYPSRVLYGGDVCRKCSGKIWDVFYIVQNPMNGSIKFGITSHDSRRRLRTHRRSGYTKTLLTRESLSGTVAPDIERAAKSALRKAGIVPVSGREYFPSSALPIVLEICETNLPESGYAK